MRLNKQSLRPLSNYKTLVRSKKILYPDEHFCYTRVMVPYQQIYILSLHIIAQNSSMALQKTQQQFEADTTQ
jgi:uncharacterized membrane protein YobD (UPF0266 family)